MKALIVVVCTGSKREQQHAENDHDAESNFANQLD
jgi:hypothetical protein